MKLLKKHKDETATLLKENNLAAAKELTENS